MLKSHMSLCFCVLGNAPLMEIISGIGGWFMVGLGVGRDVIRGVPR